MREKGKPGRRSTDVLAEDLDKFIVKTERRLRHIFIGALVSISIIAIATAAALFGLGLVVRYNHTQAVKVEEIAKRADGRSQSSAFQIRLNRQKVCSQSSNRRVACRALFERLSEALSEEQRIRLACEVVRHLHGSVAKTLREENPQCTLKHP